MATSMLSRVAGADLDGRMPRDTPLLSGRLFASRGGAATLRAEAIPGLESRGQVGRLERTPPIGIGSGFLPLSQR
jgi:hypothetical protein